MEASNARETANMKNRNQTTTTKAKEINTHLGQIKDGQNKEKFTQETKAANRFIKSCQNDAKRHHIGRNVNGQKKGTKKGKSKKEKVLPETEPRKHASAPEPGLPSALHWTKETKKLVSNRLKKKTDNKSQRTIEL